MVLAMTIAVPTLLNVQSNHYQAPSETCSTLAAPPG